MDEEKRSYAGTFALCAGALLACALWALLDDNFLRRPWKKYQAELGWREIETVEQKIAEAEQKLIDDPAYQKLLADLTVARERVEGGEASGKRRELERARVEAQVRTTEIDQDLRFVKSELEEVRYEHDHALHEGKMEQKAAAQDRIAELNQHRTEIDAR